jgi:hypothetical protein
MSTVLDDSTIDTSLIKIFTDGSKSEIGVGAGFAILNPGYPTFTKNSDSITGAPTIRRNN